MKGSKYRNKKQAIYIDGKEYRFDSMAEAERFVYLSNLQAKKRISKLELQVKFELLPSLRTVQGKTIRPLVYLADFTYLENGVLIVEDVKGFETSVYKIKKKLFLHKYNSCLLRESKKMRGGWEIKDYQCQLKKGLPHLHGF